MEFKKKRVKGRSSDTYKEWVSECGSFRITFVNEYGMRHYHACVLVANNLHGSIWGFAYRRGPHKTFNKAVESCEKSKRLWDAFVKLSHSEGRRDGRLEELKAKSPYTFMSIPLWVLKEAEPNLIRMLTPCKKRKYQDDDTEDSESSPSAESPTPCPAPKESSSPIQESGPVVTVEEKAPTAKKKTTAQSKAGSSPPGTSATSATGPAKAPKKPSKPSTKKSAKSSAKSTKRGKQQTSSAAADSEN